MINVQRYFYGFIFGFTLTVFLSSCSITGDQKGAEQEELTTKLEEKAKYSAWHLNNNPQLEAINVLLVEADALIESNALNEAEDKLERVLRIQPQYAPAWSRLSWVALQSDDPLSAVEMAKRSNSFAYRDRALQLLNWTFIRSASQQLNDTETYHKADVKIRWLKAF